MRYLAKVSKINEKEKYCFEGKNLNDTSEKKK